MTFALSNEDRIPHDRAVWRAHDGGPSPSGILNHAVSVDYGYGLIAECLGRQAAWSRVIRWRFGWEPRA